MINDITLFVLFCVIISITNLLSLVLGQHSVWRYLRKKGQVKIDK